MTFTLSNIFAIIGTILALLIGLIGIPICIILIIKYLIRYTITTYKNHNIEYQEFLEYKKNKSYQDKKSAD
ncbi:MAG: hypothetical protein KFW09_04890 [Oscillospiraceae bacterium]|nr:hypothetical protein [Oscillospiraceae bacterium]